MEHATFGAALAAATNQDELLAVAGVDEAATLKASHLNRHNWRNFTVVANDATRWKWDIWKRQWLCTWRLEDIAAEAARAAAEAAAREQLAQRATQLRATLGAEVTAGRAWLVETDGLPHELKSLVMEARKARRIALMRGEVAPAHQSEQDLLDRQKVSGKAKPFTIADQAESWPDRQVGNVFPGISGWIHIKAVTPVKRRYSPDDRGSWYQGWVAEGVYVPRERALKLEAKWQKADRIAGLERRIAREKQPLFDIRLEDSPVRQERLAALEAELAAARKAK